MKQEFSWARFEGREVGSNPRVSSHHISGRHTGLPLHERNSTKKLSKKGDHSYKLALNTKPLYSLEMKSIIFSITIILIFSFNLTAQESEIQVFPQDSGQYSGEKIIHGLVSVGVEIIAVETNFSPDSHVMGFFVDSARYMGIGEGMILSTGIVDNVNRENTDEFYTSFEFDSDSILNAPPTLIENSNSIDSKPKFFLVRFFHNLFKKKGNEVEGMNAGANEVFTPYDSSNVFANVASGWVKEGDADLSNEVKGLKTFDARVIDITFIPQADTIYYRYVFASEEYDEYVCSQFNDVFAFYLYKEGGKKKNVALVPNENVPVSINTVNNGNPANPYCEKSNSHLYQRNNGKQHLLYDGFTKVLDIRERVTAGKEYHIKITIADASDGLYDSAVLLENGSIFSYHESFEVYFEKNSFETNDSVKLKLILEKLQKYPNSKIQLIGHSDKSGSADYNLRLSKKRVKEIRKYLLSNGIEKERIMETYKGESMPRYKEDEKNRRVEVFITRG